MDGKKVKIINKFLDNAFSILFYTMLFCLLLLLCMPELSGRHIVGISVILGFFAGIINNIERVLRELFDKKED